MNDIQFAEKVNTYLNGAAALGDKSKGWDCLNSLADFFEFAGVPFPDHFGDWNWENYTKRWEKEKGAMKVLKEFLFSLGSAVDVNYMLPGDLIILERDDIVSSALYLGSGNMQIVSNPHGVLRVPMRFFKPAIIGVRRLLPK